MAVLTAFSGLNGKLPAAFLLEVAGRRLLLDLGEGPQPGLRPDLRGIGRVDAIFLSHGHIDHVGAIDLWPALGRPPVYATRATFAALPLLGLALPPTAQHLLPLQGPSRLLDLPVTLGRSGHAIGGVWLHVGADGGILYMNDWSRESLVLPLDPPPPADLVITDLSYGDRDQPLDMQAEALARLAATGAVLPVPVNGRGTELALRLLGAGLNPAICPVILAEMQALAADRSDQIAQTMRQTIRAALPALRGIRAPQEASPGDIVIVADTGRADHLLSAFTADPQGEWRFIHTGHVAAGSEAAALIRQGRALCSPWNVHPRRQDQLWLATTTRARRLLPAFGDLGQAPILSAGLAGLWSPQRVTTQAATPPHDDKGLIPC